MKDLDPCRIILNGDILDFMTVSKHEPNLEFRTLAFKEEIESGIEFLMELKANFPKAEIVFICGNHSARLAKFISRKCDIFAGLLTVEKALNLDLMKIEYVDYTPDQAYIIPEAPDTIVRHEPLSGGANPTRNSIKESRTNIIFGHIHQSLVGHHRSLDGKVLYGYSCPTLCDRHHPAFGYCKKTPQWTSGFTRVLCLPGMPAEISNIDFKEKAFYQYSARVDGRLYTS